MNNLQIETVKIHFGKLDTSETMSEFPKAKSILANVHSVKKSIALETKLETRTPTLLRRVYKCVLTHTYTLRCRGDWSLIFAKIFSLIFGIKTILFSKKSHALLEQKMNAKLTHNFGSKKSFSNSQQALIEREKLYANFAQIMQIVSAKKFLGTTWKYFQ